MTHIKTDLKANLEFPGALYVVEAFARARHLNFDGARTCLSLALRDGSDPTKLTLAVEQAHSSNPGKARDAASRFAKLIATVGMKIEKWVVDEPHPIVGSIPSAPSLATLEDAEGGSSGTTTSAKTTKTGGYYWLPKFIPPRYTPTKLALFLQMDFVNDAGAVYDFAHNLVKESLDNDDQLCSFYLVTTSHNTLIPDHVHHRLVKLMRNGEIPFAIIFKDRFAVYDTQ